MGRLLVSVRGPNEALGVAEGGAHIADVEYPASASRAPDRLKSGPAGSGKRGNLGGIDLAYTESR